MKEHASCQPSPKILEKLPRRLLYISNMDGQAYVRLVASSEYPQPLHYMALSHCWASVQVSRLLTTNEARLSATTGIDLESLGQVFQDAILVTMRFGVKYLWIDSLCILQDSLADWKAESVKMGHIYEGATCNIAATGFSNGVDGLFADRIAEDLVSIHVLLPVALTLNDKIVFPGGNCSLVDYQLWSEGVEQGPLNSRAWVVQERLLAARTLHFGAKQLYWECCEQTACEAYPSVIPSGVIMTRAKLDRQRYLSMEGPTSKIDWDARLFWPEELTFLKTKKWLPHELERVLALSTWNSVLERYGNGLLSISSDRPIAIAGLVKILQPYMASQYVAGIWRFHMHSQLLWRSVYTPGSRRNVRLGPSWSWWGTSSRFTPHAFSILELAGYKPKTTYRARRLASISCSWEGAAVSAVVDMRLGIVGPLLWMLKNLSFAGPRGLETTPIILQIYSDHDGDSGWVALDLIKHIPFDVQATVLINTDITFALPLELDVKGKVHGLLLRPVHGEQGVFERWGTFSTHAPLSKCHVPTANIPSSFHQGLDSDGRYKLEII
jgi:hypothetical protein